MASTINISLPESLMTFVKGQVEAGSFGTPSQYIRELIANDRDRRRRNLEEHLLDALKHESEGIEIPEDILENGDIVAFMEAKAAELR